ncbi:MAG: phage tail tape measure protein [Gammaproteobacteria bacterium]|nr:phage tail tape measure protein [Gammaproteobacteria bacterium]
MADQEVSLELKVTKSGLDNIEALIKELGGAGVETEKFQAQATELGSALDKLTEQQRLVDAFVKLKQETGAAEKAMQAAKAEAADLAKELKATEKPTKAQEVAFEKARKAAKGAEEAYTEQRASLQQLRGKLTDVGVSTTDLATTQVKLNNSQKGLTSEGAALVKSLTATKTAQDTLADSAKQTGYSVEQAMAKVGIRRHAEIEAEINEVRKAYKALADSGELTERELAQANLKTQESIRSLKAETNGWMQSLGKMKLELAAAGAAVYGIGRFFSSAAKESATFGAKMAEVSTLLDDTSGVDGMKDAVRQLSLEYGGDVNANAQALYDIISAGASDSATATEQLRVANQLAMGGMTDVNIAADGLTSALNAYGAAAGGAANVSDAFFTAVKAGKTTVGELSDSIGTVAPMAKTAGVSLDELLASVAALTAGGVSTRESMTQMKAALTSIIKPSKEALDLATELGIEFNVAALQTKGWAGFLDEVKTATGGNVESMGKLFGSVEGLNAVLTLTGEGSQKFAETMEEMGKKTGATAEAVEKMMDTPAVRGARFNAAMVDIRNSIGDAVTAFSPLLEGLTELINKFNTLDGDTKMVAAGLGAVAVALPPIIIAMKSLAQAYEILKVATVSSTAATAASAAATTGATVATRALSVAMRSLPLVGIAAALTAVVPMLFDWATASREAADATALADKATADLQERLAQISDETGVTVTSMEQFNQAVSDGRLVADEASGKWLSAAQVQAQLARETRNAADEQARLAAELSNRAPVSEQAIAIVALGQATRDWSDAITAVDASAKDADKQIATLLATADMGDSIQMAGLLRALDEIKTQTPELAELVEKELIGAIQKLDAQSLATLSASLKKAFDTGAISAEQFAKQSETVIGAAAKRMGIDIEESLGKTTQATRDALADLETLKQGLAAAGYSAKEQGIVIADALGKAFSSAKTKEDLDAIKSELLALGQQGILTGTQLTEMGAQYETAMQRMGVSTTISAEESLAAMQRITQEIRALNGVTDSTTGSTEALGESTEAAGEAIDEAGESARSCAINFDMGAHAAHRLGRGMDDAARYSKVYADANLRALKSMEHQVNTTESYLMVLKQADREARNTADAMMNLDRQMRRLDESQSDAARGTADLELRLLEINGTEEEIAAARLQRDKNEIQLQIEKNKIDAQRAALAGNTDQAEALKKESAELQKQIKLLDQIATAEARQNAEREKERAEQDNSRDTTRTVPSTETVKVVEVNISGRTVKVVEGYEDDLIDILEKQQATAS